jgi:hypothetical protein
MVAGKHALVVRFAAAGLAAALSINAEAGNQEERKPSSGAVRDAWPLVHIPDPVAGRASRQALDQARRLLAEPLCRSVLTQFADREGHALADRLDRLGVDVQTYLTMIEFNDGTRHRSCVEGVIGFTQPDSRVVHLCIDELKRRWQQNPTYVVAVFIHEMLHTLGLGENPPSTQEITGRVLLQCREEEE